MSENNDKFDRRSVLKSTGIAASGLLASTGVTVAENPLDSDKAKARALRSDYVQQILSELYRPEIVDVSTREITVDGQVFTGIELKTELGTLTYGEDENGDETAMFEFDGTAIRKNASKKLLKEYRLAESNEAILTIDAEDGVVFMRAATSAEEHRLTKITGVDPDDAAMFYNSLIDGFEVHLPNEADAKDGERKTYLVQPSDRSKAAGITGASSEVTDF